jgi:hypothetical protein
VLKYNSAKCHSKYYIVRCNILIIRIIFVIPEYLRWTKTTDNLSLTCPNSKCGKVITKPLLTLNLQQSSKKPYEACPYCLTEIDVSEAKKIMPPQDTVSEVASSEEKPSQNQEKVPDCKHFFGYMSEKEHKKEMPDECMLCSKIIQCMAKENWLKKTTRIDYS